ncbi:MAG: SDR family oxidoreductase [Moraxellaceae bacterium]|nr:SDR family oxidoreductase [Moraxellaceae bacterium]
MANNILMIGCGDVGLNLANALIELGHQLTIIKRSPLTGINATVIEQDVSQPFSLNGLAPDYVFIILSPSASTPEAYQQVFVEGVKNVAQALQGHTPKRVFFVSSTSVYGQDAGEWVSEQSTTEPTRFNGQILRQAEDLCWQTWPNSTVLRCGGIYGAGRLRLVNWVQSGREVKQNAWTNRVHVADVVGILLFLLQCAEQQRVLDKVYLAVDDCPVLQEDVLDWLAQQLNLPFVPKVAAAPSNKRLSNQRIKSLGYVFKYPCFKEGYGAMLAESSKQS